MNESQTQKYIVRSENLAARMLGGEMMIMSAADSTLFSLNETASRDLEGGRRRDSAARNRRARNRARGSRSIRAPLTQDALEFIEIWRSTGSSRSPTSRAARRAHELPDGRK